MTFQPWQAKGPTKHSVAKRTECACGITHDSKSEQRRCRELALLERAGEIAGLQRQRRYEFRIDGKPIMMENGQCARYTADFAFVCTKRGVMIAEDVKASSKRADDASWPLRKALFRHLYPMIELREVRGG